MVRWRTSWRSSGEPPNAGSVIVCANTLSSWDLRGDPLRGHLPGHAQSHCSIDTIKLEEKPISIICRYIHRGSSKHICSGGLQQTRPQSKLDLLILTSISIRITALTSACSVRAAVHAGSPADPACWVLVPTLRPGQHRGWPLLDSRSVLRPEYLVHVPFRLPWSFSASDVGNVSCDRRCFANARVSSWRVGRQNGEHGRKCEGRVDASLGASPPPQGPGFHPHPPRTIRML